jgi:hypothetical protein
VERHRYLHESRSRTQPTIKELDHMSGTTPVDTRPLLLGYVRAHLLMTAAELVQIKDQLVTFAQAEGFTLGKVYTEHAHTFPAAFEALVQAVRRDEVRAVVVPSLQHLGVLGAPQKVKEGVEQTPARVSWWQRRLPEPAGRCADPRIRVGPAAPCLAPRQLQRGLWAEPSEDALETLRNAVLETEGEIEDRG